MTDFPSTFYPVIVAGADWHWVVAPFRHTGVLGPKGDIFDWPSYDDRFELTSEIRDRTGTLLASFSSEAGADGTLTGLADGTVAYDLAQEFTEVLPVTRLYTNSTDPRVAGWRHRGAHAIDLVVIDHDDGDTQYILLSGQATVQQLVTGGP